MFFFFFFNGTATPRTYTYGHTLSLPDALPIFDELTGLANRQQMKRSLDQTLAQSRRTYRPTALFLLDLDRFKAVNDTLGHQTGDELLKQVAQRLQRAIGDKGLVGRLGGDEFEEIGRAQV